VKQEQRKWLVCQKDYALEQIKQQTLGGIPVIFPDANYLGNGFGDTLIRPGGRTKSRIFVKGIQLQATFECCLEYPMILNVAVVQPKPTDYDTLVELKTDFFNNRLESAADGDKNFTNDTSTYQPGMNWDTINTDKLNVLTRFTKQLQPQSYTYAELNTTTAETTTGVANTVNGPAQCYRMNKFFPLNSYFEFKTPQGNYPTHPIFFIYWMTQSVPAFFGQTADKNVCCIYKRTTVLYKE